LNGAHDVIAVRVVTVGFINRTIVHPRKYSPGTSTSPSRASISIPPIRQRSRQTPMEKLPIYLSDSRRQ
jgi:hypothetical protein